MHSFDLLFFFATNVPIGSVRTCDCANTRLAYKNTQTVVRRWLNEMNCCCKDSAGEKWPLLLMPCLWPETVASLLQTTLAARTRCFFSAADAAGCRPTLLIYCYWNFLNLRSSASSIFQSGVSPVVVSWRWLAAANAAGCWPEEDARPGSCAGCWFQEVAANAAGCWPEAEKCR